MYELWLGLQSHNDRSTIGNEGTVFASISRCQLSVLQLQSLLYLFDYILVQVVQGKGRTNSQRKSLANSSPCADPILLYHETYQCADLFIIYNLIVRSECTQMPTPKSIYILKFLKTQCTVMQRVQFFFKIWFFSWYNNNALQQETIFLQS